MVCHDGKLKLMGNVPTKRRLEVVATRRKKSTKSSALAKASYVHINCTP